tara:strand:- start:17464 stop:18519 length:1056 start_codon:yes stop_codon:yes gene_type:complete
MFKTIATFIIILLPFISNAQFDLEDFCKKTFKFSTFYAAASGGTSVSDVESFSVKNGLTTTTIKTPYDYNLAFGIRKIARFGYENKANTFYDGTEESFSDAASVGKVKGLEFLFEIDMKRQKGVEYLDQNHFVRYVADYYILKGEYLADGFTDIEYFETSQRYRYKINNKLSVNIGASQRLSEPYGYDPLEEWMLASGGIHYTYLAIQEGYNIDVYESIYTNSYGDVVANSVEVWEEVIIPEVLYDYTEKKRNELDRKMQQSLVVGFDYYYYSKNFWSHSWANLMPWHYNDGGKFSYHNYNNKKQWYDYSGGLIFGYKANKHLGFFIEGKYNKYWNREWYDFKGGINYVIF